MGRARGSLVAALGIAVAVALGAARAGAQSGDDRDRRLAEIQESLASSVEGLGVPDLTATVAYAPSEKRYVLRLTRGGPDVTPPYTVERFIEAADVDAAASAIAAAMKTWAPGEVKRLLGASGEREGDALIPRGQCTKAIERYEAARATFPASLGLRYKLGVAYEGCARPADALLAYRDFVEGRGGWDLARLTPVRLMELAKDTRPLPPTPPRAQEAAALAHERFAANDIPGAEAAASHAILAAPWVAELYADRARYEIAAAARGVPGAADAAKADIDAFAAGAPTDLRVTDLRARLASPEAGGSGVVSPAGATSDQPEERWPYGLSPFTIGLAGVAPELRFPYNKMGSGPPVGGAFTWDATLRLVKRVAIGGFGAIRQTAPYTGQGEHLDTLWRAGAFVRVDAATWIRAKDSLQMFFDVRGGYTHAAGTLTGPSAAGTTSSGPLTVGGPLAGLTFGMDAVLGHFLVGVYTRAWFGGGPLFVGSGTGASANANGYLLSSGGGEAFSVLGGWEMLGVKLGLAR